MLDKFTSSMCINAWGRPSYARAMIEVSAKKALKECVIVDTPCLNDIGGFMKDIVKVEYEWKPPRCNQCKVFGHTNGTCPPKVVQKDAEGFVEVKNHKGKSIQKDVKQKKWIPSW